MNRRQAFSAWERHLEEMIGVSDAHVVTDRLDDLVTREDLDTTRADLEAALAAQSEQITTQLTGQLSSLWRRDLLLIITGQFVALAGVLTAIS